MKKITRIAALLAAGALLFGAVGCSSGGDGDGDDPSRGTTPVSYTLKAGTPNFDSGSLEVSGMDTTEDTGDDTFKMTLKPTGKDAVTVTGTWELTTEDSFVCKPTEDVEINGITVTKATGATGTINDDDSITLTVAEGVSLVFVKNEDTSGGTPPAAGEGDSYDFADLSAADLAKFGITSMSGGNDVKITQTSTADAPHMVLNGKVGVVATAANKLSVKPKNGEPLAIGFGTNGVNNIGVSATVGDTVTVDHFISYPVEAGKKYQMSITSGGQANKAEHYFIVTNSSGKILTSKVCSTSTTDAVTLDVFEAEESTVRLTNARTVAGAEASGTTYFGKVTITEISGGDSSNNGSETPGGTPGEDGGEEGDDNNSGTVTPGTPGSGEGEGEETPDKPDDEEPAEKVVTVKWYDFSASGTAVAHTATASDADVLTGGDFTVDVSIANITGGTYSADPSKDGKCSNNSTETDAGSKIIGAQWTLLNSIISSTTANSDDKYQVTNAGDIFGSLSYTVTAETACKITELSATIGTSNTSNVTWKVEGKKNSGDAVEIASTDGKLGSFSKKLEIPVELAANDTYTVTITAIAKSWSEKTANTSKNVKATVGQVVVKAAAAE